MPKKKKKAQKSYHTHLFTAVGLLMAMILLPTTFLLVIGLVPTFVAFFADRTQKKTRVLTIGAMNLAGCSPFFFELWMQGNDFDKSIEIVLDPVAVVVMYSAAGVGYIIDWGMSSFVAQMMYQKGLSRRKDIRKKQAELIKRWGVHVKGDVPLDDYGFPIAKPAKPKDSEND